MTELSTPIQIQGEILGAIGLLCVTSEQKSLLVSGLDSYKAFLSQIAEFISAKVYERREAERTSHMIELLNKILDLTDKGKETAK